MMYSNHFAVAIKVDGKVLREDGDTVYLPFGSEYTVLLKNISSRRAEVKVSVDGTDATKDMWLIVNANDSLELERFVSSGNMKRGNRFRFIERTDEIEEHRGIKADDGLVRVEYRFEREKPQYTTWNSQGTAWNAYPPLMNAQYTYTPTVTTGPIGVGVCCNYLGATNSSGGAIRSAGLSAFAEETALRGDAGITVAGSESNQQFTTVAGFETDASRVIVLRLKGRGRQAAIQTPVTVDRKPHCPSCGRSNKAANRFCAACGTGLELFS